MAALLHIKREGRGALIHVSSLEAKHSFPFHTAYAAAKHGIDGFLETLRVELKHEGLPISVTQVLPGTINTPLFDKVAPSSVSSLLACRRSTNLTSSQTSSSTPLSIRPATWSPGGAAQAMILNQRLSSRLVDAILATRGLRTTEDRRAQVTRHAGQPLRAHRSHDTVKNGFRALSRSLYNWLQMHPTARRVAAIGTALGLLGALRRWTVEPARGCP